MIIYITLAYGLIVTAGAVWVYLLMRREVKRAHELVEGTQDIAGDFARLWGDAEARLYDIKVSCHESAKHARAAQIAQRKAQVLAKAAELQVDRIAA